MARMRSSYVIEDIVEDFDVAVVVFDLVFPSFAVEPSGRVWDETFLDVLDGNVLNPMFESLNDQGGVSLLDGSIPSESGVPLGYFTWIDLPELFEGR